MPSYNEYTTVNAIRSAYLDIVGTADDVLMLDFIREICNDIKDIGKHEYAPRIATRTYDVPRNARGELFLGDDLLELTTLTNGDDTVIASTDYILNPANETPKLSIELVETSGVIWQSDAGNYRQVISVAGVWGWHDDYASAWRDTLATILNSGGVNASATSLTVLTGKIKAGQLLKCESEFWYASEVTTGSPNDTVTIVRAVNGSTAAAHAQSTVIYYWDFKNIGALARRATVALYKTRDNPNGETIQIDGNTFVTPRDVTAYLRKQLLDLGKKRVIFA